MEQKFIEWVATLSTKFKQAQSETVSFINHQMISFFTDLGKEIHEARLKEKYGNGLIEEISEEFLRTLPNKQIFSKENLEYVEAFYVLQLDILRFLFEENPSVLDNPEKCALLSADFFSKIAKISWMHHRVIIDFLSNKPKEAWLYINKAIKGGWTSKMLLESIEEEFVFSSSLN